MTLKIFSANIHIHNTYSQLPQSVPSMWNYLRICMRVNSFLFHLLSCNADLHYFHHSYGWYKCIIYLRTEHVQGDLDDAWYGWLIWCFIWWPAASFSVLTRLRDLLMKYYSDSSRWVANFASTIVVFTWSYMVTIFSCFVQYFLSLCCLSPLLLSNWSFFIFVKFLYQVRPNFLVGVFELDWWKRFIAVARVDPVMRELSQPIISYQVIGWPHSWFIQIYLNSIGSIW